MTDFPEREQVHPQYATERKVVDQLLQVEIPTDHDFAEAGRLLVRFNHFPGASDIKRDLQTILSKWDLTEAGLFERTREIHNRPEGTVYLITPKRDDWA